jgi:hypothetical protein
VDLTGAEGQELLGAGIYQQGAAVVDAGGDSVAVGPADAGSE